MPARITATTAFVFLETLSLIHISQKVVYGAFDQIKEKTEKDPIEVFNQAMENIMPSLEVKARRVGGATYQVPMEVRPARRTTLGLRWLTAYARSRSERTMACLLYTSRSQETSPMWARTP